MKQLLNVRHTYKGKFLRAYKLRGGMITVGSTKNAKIHLVGSHAAGLVCLIQREGGNWKIYDLGSEPDVKVDKNEFSEFNIENNCQLQIGENTLHIEPSQPRKKIFADNSKSEAPSGESLFVAKWHGHILGASYNKNELDPHLSSIEISEFRFSKKNEIDKESIHVPMELRKPLISTFATLFVFIILLLGLPKFKADEPEKPKDNVYTRMIFDSKILAEKKKELQSSGTKLLRGNGGNGLPMSGITKSQPAESKAVASLRKAGISQIIGKIAIQASKSANLVAKLAAMPSANASINGQELNSLSQIPTGASTQGKSGKSDMLGGAGGFKVGKVGTAGKGGGSGGYKNGSQLGNGGVGEGNIAIDDTESIVEGGLDKEVIAKVIREHLGQIRYCYDRQLASDSELHGKVKVKFDINAEGLVETQSVGESTMNNAMVEECILRRIATWKFPKPRGGTKVLVSYPFLFKSVN